MLDILKYASIFEKSAIELEDEFEESMYYNYTIIQSHLLSLAENLGLKITTLGKVHEDGKICPIYMFSNSSKNKGPELLITAGFHGNEPAGPLGLIRFMKKYNNLLNKANITFVPLVNPIGLMKFRRGGQDGLDTNRGFVPCSIHYPLSVEGKILMKNREVLLDAAADGHVSMHEDPEGQGFFIYSWEKEPGIIGNDMVEFGKKYLPVATEEYLKRKGHNSKNGLVLNENHSSFGELVESAGLPISVTIETPCLKNLKERSIDQCELVREFVEYCISKFKQA